MYVVQQPSSFVVDMDHVKRARHRLSSSARSSREARSTNTLEDLSKNAVSESEYEKAQSTTAYQSSRILQQCMYTKKQWQVV